MKKLSLAVLLTVAVAGVAFAQDDMAAKQSRNLSLYTEFSSGQLAPGVHTADGGKVSVGNTGRDQAFEGIEAEWGFRYNQNFKSVPWLTMGGTFAYVMNYDPAHDGNNNFVGTASGGWRGASIGNIKSNVWLSMPYFMILFDARGLMGAYLSYNASFGKGGSLGVAAELEYFFTGDPWYGNPDPGTLAGRKAANGVGPNYIVDYFGLGVSYGVGLGKGFSYSMLLQFRMFANPWNGFRSVEFDPLGSMGIRWNNTFAYGVDGWSFFLQFRLEALGIAGSGNDTFKGLKYDPIAVFQIITGLSYNFDFSK